MELRIAERLNLLNLLPKEGNVATLRMVRELQTDLSLSDEELEAIGLVQGEDLVRWSQEKEQALDPKDIEFSRPRRRLIVKTLKQLETQQKLTLPLLNLYDKFVEEGEEDDEEE